MQSAEDKEHVTRHFYQNSGPYRIFNFQADRDYSRFNLCIDTPADLERFAAAAAKKDLSSISWREAVELYEAFVMKAVS